MDSPKLLGYFVATEAWWDENWKHSKGSMTFERIHPSALYFFHPKKEIVEQIFATMKLRGDVLNPKYTCRIFQLTELGPDNYKIDKA